MRFLSILKNRLLVHFSDKLFVLHIDPSGTAFIDIRICLKKGEAWYVPVFWQ